MTGPSALAGEPVATFSVLSFTFLPPVLAHAGLAATDMALTAMLSVAFFIGLKWVAQPTARNSIFSGAVMGLAVVSKFSSLPFLPAAAIAALIWWTVAEKPKLTASTVIPKYVAPLLLAAATMFLVVWAVYRFSFHAIHFVPLHVPFPELFQGVKEVVKHDIYGHPAFLLGGHSSSGFPPRIYILMYWSGVDALDACRGLPHGARPQASEFFARFHDRKGVFVMTNALLPVVPVAKLPIGNLYSIQEIPFEVWSPVASEACQ